MVLIVKVAALSSCVSVGKSVALASRSARTPIGSIDVVISGHVGSDKDVVSGRC